MIYFCNEYTGFNLPTKVTYTLPISHATLLILPASHYISHVLRLPLARPYTQPLLNHCKFYTNAYTVDFKCYLNTTAKNSNTFVLATSITRTNT